MVEREILEAKLAYAADKLLKSTITESCLIPSGDIFIAAGSLEEIEQLIKFRRDTGTLV